MRSLLIRTVLPFIFCLVPALAGLLVAVAVPADAQSFYLKHLSTMDWLIIALGVVLFTTQTMLAWRALRWRGTNFDEKSDRWLTNLAQAAEWFPLLGLLGTVAGILQTFSAISGPVEPARVIALYAPAITATGSGLFMALLNILPTWMVMFGRDVLLALGGGDAPTGDLPT
ncbi:MAG TPA: MotA/TolQ/ExbB proton channel family protein [Gemmataceae bacterium]|nr:MotA/TolQ/ExbB proton channel family protein [Gemmataceae bacterium]